MTWVEGHLESLEVIHVPGQENILADSISRTTMNDNKWSLSSVRADLPEVWETGGGPFHNFTEQTGPEVHLPNKDGFSNRDGRPHKQLAIWPALCISSNSPHFESDTKKFKKWQNSFSLPRTGPDSGGFKI